jgi:hypothetical protein
LDDPSGNYQFDWGVVPFASNPNFNLGIGLTTHLFDHLIERQSLDRHVIEMGDDIIWPYSSFLCGCIFDDSHSVDQSAVLCDLNSDPGEIRANNSL